MTGVRCVGQPRRGNLWDTPYQPPCGWTQADVVVIRCPECGGQVGQVGETDWREGYRHCVKDTPPQGGWECIWCGQQFETWPSDLIECPGPQAKVPAEVKA
jgi:DNA-directed RNA polymerase subunit RPC12/RpoP